MLKKTALKEIKKRTYVLQLLLSDMGSKDKDEVSAILKSFIKEDCPQGLRAAYFAEIDMCVTSKLRHISVYSNKERTFGQFEYFYEGKKHPYVRACGTSFDYDSFEERHEKILKASGEK